MAEELPTDIHALNSAILKYLYEKSYIGNYKDIDVSFGYSSGYFSKIANGDKKLKKIHAIALEYEYKVPRNIFWNENIKTTQDIEDTIRENRHKFSLLVENKAPESLEKFKEYQYFYIYDTTTNDIVKRTIRIKNQSVEIFNNNNKLDFKGFIHTSSTSLILITENPITGNNVVFKVKREALKGNILVISFMGHRSISNEEVVGHGICSKKELNDEDIKTILSVNKHLSFSAKKYQIIQKIKQFKIKK